MDVLPASDLRQSRSSRKDVVFIRGLSSIAKVGNDAWHRPGRAQPVLIDARLAADLQTAGTNDSLEGGVDYGKVSKAILEAVRPNAEFKDLREVYEAANKACIDTCGHRNSEITITLPEGALLTDGVGVRFTMPDDPRSCFFVKRLRVACFIGLNPHERTSKQELLVDLKLEPADGHWFMDYQTLVRIIAEDISISSYKTLEALAESIVHLIFSAHDPSYAPSGPTMTVSIEKPKALAFAQGPGIEITRSFSNMKI